MKEISKETKLVCILEGIIVSVYAIASVMLSTYMVDKIRFEQSIKNDFFQKNFKLFMKIINWVPDMNVKHIVMIMEIILSLAIVISLLLIPMLIKKYPMVNRLKKLFLKISTVTIIFIIYIIGCIFLMNEDNPFFALREFNIGMFNEFMYKLIAIFIVFLIASIITKVLILRKDK